MQTTPKAPSTTHRQATKRPVRRPLKKPVKKVTFERAMRALRSSSAVRRNQAERSALMSKQAVSRDPKSGSVEDRAREAATNDAMLPLSPSPSVLLQPVATLALEAHSVGSGVERAQAAALAEKLLESVRVGRVGDGHEVHLRLTGVDGRGGIDVQLRHENGELTAVLRPEADAAADADRLAKHFARELRARGLEIEDVRVDFG